MFLSFDVPGHINGTRTVTGRQTQAADITSYNIGKNRQDFPCRVARWHTSNDAENSTSSGGRGANANN